MNMRATEINTANDGQRSLVGDPCPAPLGESLVSKGLLNQAQLAKALES